MSYVLTDKGREHLREVENEAAKNLLEFGVIPLGYRTKMMVLWSVDEIGELPESTSRFQDERSYLHNLAYNLWRKGYIEKV